jgi:hypothetical protein
MISTNMLIQIVTALAVLRAQWAMNSYLIFNLIVCSIDLRSCNLIELVEVWSV